MANDRIMLPSSGGGIIRYSEEDIGKVKISPMTVIVVIAIIIVLALLFRSGFFGIFG